MGLVLCNADNGSENHVIAEQLTPPSGQRRRKKPKFTVDSGATIHCINDPTLFTSFTTDCNVRISTASKAHPIHARAVGTVEMQLEDNHGTLQTITLHNVAYAPEFHSNLISVRRLWKDSRVKTRFGATNYFKSINPPFKCMFDYNREYTIHRASHHETINVEQLHSRFGHVGSRRLKKLLTRADGLPIVHGGKDALKDFSTHTCPACLEGGAKRKPFKRNRHIYTYFGQKISSDLCGPFPTSINGYYYALCFTDAHTRYTSVYYLKTKSSNEVREGFEQFLSEFKHLVPESKQITWHTDNGGEFISQDLDEFCQEFAIRRSFSVPYAPPQNAQAERMWGKQNMQLHHILARR